MAKLVVHNDDGSVEEVTEETGFIACWWEDRKEQNLRYLVIGMPHFERVRLVGILIDGLADDIEKATVTSEEQLAIDQFNAVRKAEGLLSA